MKRKTDFLGQLAGEFVPVYKTGKLEDKPKIGSSQDAVNFLTKIWETGAARDINSNETFIVLYLDRQNKVKGWEIVGQGSLTGCAVDIQAIFLTALQCKAAGLILCHNHPSGNMKASQQDTALTKKIKQAGTLLDVQVLDHVILSPEILQDITHKNYFSFADDGIL
jgi:DNA repair protein RadC